MKKLKELIVGGLIGLSFVGMVYIGILINEGTLSRLQAGFIMISGFIAVIAICMALTNEKEFGSIEDGETK